MEYFASRHRHDIEEAYRHKPRTILHNALKEGEIAQNLLYGDLVKVAYHKEKVLSFLRQLDRGNIVIEEGITDPRHYISSYLGKVKEILNKIADNSYSFQLPSSGK